ncbi:MAG TPA: ABC transporter permease [Pseudonocardiaceae bacterium]|jgi:osmoprotectant transport system permease protein|nr:ABC transporter permease [Pseudonocardiaceae bacterium]
MTWAFTANHSSELLTQTGVHVLLALLPLVFGLIISVPLGWLAARWRVARAILIPLGGLLYTIPSIALLIILPVILGTPIVDPVNVVVALTIYTVALLVRAVADSLASVPANVLSAANAIGYRRAGRFFGVELPLSIPVLVAGLRVAAVSNMSLVSVGALVGIGGLGQLMTEGYNRFIPGETATAIVAILVLALIIDGLLTFGGRLLSPWHKASRSGATA